MHACAVQRQSTSGFTMNDVPVFWNVVCLDYNLPKQRYIRNIPVPSEGKILTLEPRSAATWHTSEYTSQDLLCTRQQYTTPSGCSHSKTTRMQFSNSCMVAIMAAPVTFVMSKVLRGVRPLCKNDIRNSIVYVVLDVNDMTSTRRYILYIYRPNALVDENQSTIPPWTSEFAQHLHRCRVKVPFSIVPWNDFL